MVRTAVRGSTVWLVVLILAVAGPARAQYLHGTIRDTTTGSPVVGAVVVLSDTGRRFMARTLADTAGRFAFVRVRGARHLHVVRIGYQPRDVDLALGDADSVVDIGMRPIAAALIAVKASSRRVCPGETGDGGALALWEQARAALLASVVNRETRPPRILVRSYDRTLEPVRRRLQSETTTVKEIAVDRSYVAARPAWAFARQGYMLEEAGGARNYFAPDEEVLLDPSFAAVHCLHLVEGRGPHGSEIGIGFDPIDEAGRDTLVDVKGIVWLDRAHPGLRSLEFEYTNVEPKASGSGGDIRFVELQNGTSLIQAWTIHTVVLAYDAERLAGGINRQPPPRSGRTDARLLAYRETGGTVGAATWPDGTQSNFGLGRVRGVAVDDSGRSVPRAVVWLFGSPDTVRADDGGNFELPLVFPGVYNVLASDSVLASQGIARTVALTTRVEARSDVAVRVLVYARSAVLPLVCPSNSYKPGTGVLLARVVRADGTAAGGAQIEVAARQTIVAGDSISRVRTGTGEAGDDGRFAICGAALDQPFAIRATKGSESATMSFTRWTDEVIAVTLTLKSNGV